MTESLSSRGRNLVKKIAKSEDGEVVYEHGAGWWVGPRRVASRDVYELIRANVLRADSFNTEKFQRYTLATPDERKAASNG